MALNEITYDLNCNYNGKDFSTLVSPSHPAILAQLAACSCVLCLWKFFPPMIFMMFHSGFSLVTL